LEVSLSRAPLSRRRWRKADEPLPRGGALVAEHRLRNGMRVLLAERHTDPVVSVLLFYRVGSRDEIEEHAGVSHFLEHMMFKGTPRCGKGEVDRITTMLGGHNNAFTSQDHTAYWFELASDRWETALEIEADRMTNLSLDPVEFESERAVVLDELAMGEDDPWRVLTRRAQAALFPRHPYRWPVIGYEETVANLTADDMRRHYERFYCPANATLVIAGDVSPRAALKAVRRHFGDLPAGVVPPGREARASSVLEEPGGETRIGMTWDDPARRLCMVWPTSAMCSDDDYTLDVLATLLASGRLSRLQRRLVLDDGLASNVSVSNEAWVDTGTFWILAECAQGRVPEELERVIDDELEKLAKTPVRAAELARANSILCASEAYDSETVSDLSEELGEYAVDADWRLAFDGGARHRAVTPAQLRECVRRLLGRDRRVLGWCTRR
jgi:zinc protease